MNDRKLWIDSMKFNCRSAINSLGSAIDSLNSARVTAIQIGRDEEAKCLYEAEKAIERVLKKIAGDDEKVSSEKEGETRTEKLLEECLGVLKDIRASKHAAV